MKSTLRSLSVVLTGVLAGGFGLACSADGGNPGGAGGDLSSSGGADLALSGSPDLATVAAPDLSSTATLSVGDVVPDLTFSGYFSPTMTTGLASAQTFGTVSFSQAKSSGAKLMMVMLAGFT